RDRAGARAGEAMTPRAEGRARDEHVGLAPIELGRDRTRGFFSTLADEVVAADQGRLDARAVAQRRLQQTTRPHGTGLHRHADVGLVLAADPAEELVHVVHDAKRTA